MLGFGWRTRLRTVLVAVLVGAATVSAPPAQAATQGRAELGPTVRTAVAAARSPIGSLDDLTIGTGTVRLQGWTLDLDAPTTSIEVHVYDQQPDGSQVGRAFVAAASRPDVGAAYPGTGSQHGFDITVSPQGTGRHTLCLFAIDPQGSGATLLACRPVDVPPPVGSLDIAQNRASGTVLVRGWAAEFDLPDGQPEINVYVRGPSGTQRGYGQDAFQTFTRRDVKAVVPWAGPNIGFGAELPIYENGANEVCAFAISRTAPRAVTLLGCVTATVVSPFGSFDSASVNAGRIRVQGWAINPNSPLQQATVYATDVTPGGIGNAVTAKATVDRPDVNAVFPGYGGTPGFDITLPAGPSGAHQVCVYATALSGGLKDTALGCRDVTVP